MCSWVAMKLCVILLNYICFYGSSIRPYSAKYTVQSRNKVVLKCCWTVYSQTIKYNNLTLLCVFVPFFLSVKSSLKSQSF